MQLQLQWNVTDLLLADDQGVTSVRAYGVQKEMHDQFRDLLDVNNRAYIMFVHASRWLGIRLDFGAAMCLTTTALLSVLLRHQVNPGYIGNSPRTFARALPFGDYLHDFIFLCNSIRIVFEGCYIWSCFWGILISRKIDLETDFDGFTMQVWSWSKVCSSQGFSSTVYVWWPTQRTSSQVWSETRLILSFPPKLIQILHRDWSQMNGQRRARLNLLIIPWLTE